MKHPKPGDAEETLDESDEGDDNPPPGDSADELGDGADNGTDKKADSQTDWVAELGKRQAKLMGRQSKLIDYLERQGERQEAWIDNLESANDRLRDENNLPVSMPRTRS